MTKKYFILIVASLLSLAVRAEKIKGTMNLTVGNTTLPAYVTYDTEARTATLGNGYNACITHFEEGSLTVPGTCNYNGQDYTVVIGPMAFRFCSGLTTAVVEEGVTQIGSYAFVGCGKLASITLPTTLQTIGSGAFAQLPLLKNMECKSETAPTWLWNDVFAALGTKESMAEMASERILFVPEGKYAAYFESKFDGTSTGANQKVGWEEAFTRIYETTDQPQVISTLQDLQDFRNAVNTGGLYKGSSAREVTLTADIDLSSVANWEPIGTSDHPYKGIFNGGGHVIKNLKINRSGEDNIGLFGYASNAIIYNMYLLNPSVYGRDYVGSVLGRATEGTHVTDVLVTSDASTGNDYTVKSGSGSGGGIVGWAKNAAIERCMFLGQVKCFGWVGGIIGNVSEGVAVTNCSAANFIQSVDPSTDHHNRMGGIVGGAGIVNVDHCFARNIFSKVENTYPWFGAISGAVDNTGLGGVSNCVYWSVQHSSSGFNSMSETNEIYRPAYLYNNAVYLTEEAMLGDATKATLGDEWYYFTENLQDFPVPTTLLTMYLEYTKYCTNADGLVLRPVTDTGRNITAYEVLEYRGDGTSLTIPDTYMDKPVTAILPEAFKGNTILETITIGSNVINIGNSAFEDCDALTAIDLPDAVTTVGEKAFVGCDNLESFNIGKGLTNYTGNFLTDCPKLASITASRGNDHEFYCYDNVLMKRYPNNPYIRELLTKLTLVACAPAKTGIYTTPSKSDMDCYFSVIEIGDHCFRGCTSLTGIKVAPKEPYGGSYYSLELGKAVFEGATNLRFIDLLEIYRYRHEYFRDGERFGNYTLDRSAPDNPFYGLSNNTIVYMPYYLDPEDQDIRTYYDAVQGEPNAVRQNRMGPYYSASVEELILTDGWDFVPRVEFTAKKVTYNRTLQSTRKEMTEEGEQDVIVDGETQKEQVVTGYEYPATGYSVYLPYDLTLTAENAKVYAPSKIEDLLGETVVTFSEVESKSMAAYTPYYIVVEGEDKVSLNTTSEVFIKKLDDYLPAPFTDGGFQFKGTTVEIPNSTLYDEKEPAYILQSDGNWHRVPENEPLAYVGPFRAYFQAMSPVDVLKLTMLFGGSYNPGEGSGPVNLPIVRTIDNDGTERYFDLNGRIIDENAKGIVIKNGKKYLKK